MMYGNQENIELIRLQQLFQKKNEYLNTYYDTVDQFEFYRDIFPVGSFERKGHLEDGKPNGLALDIRGKGEAYHRLISDELDELNDLKGTNFVIMSPIGYFGNRRSGENARCLYAFTIDLDGVEMGNLRDVTHQMDNEILPKASYIVNSGTGLHLYYVLQDPVALYPVTQKKLKEMKYALTERIWNRYTSTQKDIQRQGIMQGFRIVGSPSKLGSDFPVTAFRYGGRVTLEYLNDFVPAEVRIKNIKANGGLSLDEAKKKYPEWYERRVVRGEPRGRWTVKRDLYDWWKKRVSEEIVVGHRFYGIFTLAVYAMKCGINEDELIADAYELMKRFDGLSIDERNRFTEDDVIAALEVFNESYVTFPRDDISKITGLPIKVNKRNGRKQGEHLRRARAVQAVDYPNGEWRGRPSARQLVEEYITKNPSARKCDVIKALGLDKKTVYKYY